MNLFTDAKNLLFFCFGKVEITVIKFCLLSY